MMKASSFGKAAALAAAVPVFVALWPAACTGVRGQGQHAASAKPGEVMTPDQVRATDAPLKFLPHPALAYAKAGTEGAVSIADITERALPSVVSISSTRVVRAPAMDPMFQQFFGPLSPFGGGGDRKEQGLGSGVVVSVDGIVLTNNHVVERADEIKVALGDGREFDAEVAGRDEKSDLAVLRLKGDAKGLTAIRFGDSARLRLGDVVLAIGNPFGVGQTVTMGIVSAKGRTNMGIEDYEDFIQTDAAINPGNSGGALINMEGELIGINTAILSRSGGSMGIGFAIPSNMARPISDSLLQSGKVVRGYLGVGIQDLTSDLAKALNVEKSNGVVVTDVAKDSPAAKAGVQRGDVVLSVDRQVVDSTGRLRNLIAQAGVSKVTLEVLRGGTKLELQIALAEAPQVQAASPTSGVAKPGGALDGLTLESLTDTVRRKYSIDSSVKSGAVITSLAPNSPAAAAGLRPGDVVLEVNRVAVKDPESFNRAYQKSKNPLLLISRGGNTQYVVLKSGG